MDGATAAQGHKDLFCSSVTLCLRGPSDDGHSTIRETVYACRSRLLRAHAR